MGWLGDKVKGIKNWASGKSGESGNEEAPAIEIDSMIANAEIADDTGINWVDTEPTTVEIPKKPETKPVTYDDRARKENLPRVLDRERVKKDITTIEKLPSKDTNANLEWVGDDTSDIDVINTEEEQSFMDKLKGLVKTKKDEPTTFEVTPTTSGVTAPVVPTPGAVTAPVVPTPDAEEEQEEESKKKGIVGSGKEFQTTDELKKSFWSNLSGVGGGETSEDRYARIAEYSGSSREELNSDISRSGDRLIELKDRLIEKDREISEQIKEVELLRKQPNKTKEDGDRYDRAKAILKDLKSERSDINTEIGKLEDQLIKDRRSLVKYEEAVIKGKRKASFLGRNKKTFENIGEGATDVTTNLWKGKIGQLTGKDGVLSEPFKRSNLLSNPVEPVKTKASYLNSVTQGTGSVMNARQLITAVTTLPKPSQSGIEPMGVPGTVYGARQKFDYRIPAKRIGVGDVVSNAATNINRDIMPNIFSPKKIAIAAPVASIAQPIQFHQVTQPDGSVVNTPIAGPEHFRNKKSNKPLVAMANAHGLKYSTPMTFKQDKRLALGVQSVGTFKPMVFTNNAISQFKQVSKPAKAVVQNRKPKLLEISINRYTNLITNKPVKKDRFDLGIKSVGSINIAVIPKARTKFDLGLISTNVLGKQKFGFTDVEVAKEFRTSKNSSSSVNMTSMLNVGKNISKMISKRKVIK